jgi:hypothetical protein
MILPTDHVIQPLACKLNVIWIEFQTLHQSIQLKIYLQAEYHKYILDPTANKKVMCS